jgi:hypothetical protein
MGWPMKWPSALAFYPAAAAFRFDLSKLELSRWSSQVPIIS